MSANKNHIYKIILTTALVLVVVAVSSLTTWWIFSRTHAAENKSTSMGVLSVASKPADEINLKGVGWNFPAGSVDPLMTNDTYWMWRSENRLPSEKVAAESNPSAGCQKTFGWPSVQIPMDQFNLAFGTKPGEVAELPIEVDPAEVCFTGGYGIWLIAVQSTAAGLFSPDAIWSRIVRIEKGATEGKIKLITQFVGTPIYHWPSRVLPPFHPQAKILNREGVIQMISDFDYVVDVRTTGIQQQWPLPWKNVISIPYIASTESLADYKADRTDNRRARHVELADQWPESKWKNWGQDKKILIVGQNPTDPRPFRALTWLAEAGFKNIYWFYEGADAFHQPMNEIPTWNTYSPYNWTDHIPNIEQQLSSGQALLIDLRSAQDFKRIRHPKAVNKPYLEKNIDSVGLLRGLNALDVFHIIKSADQFDLSEIPTDRKVYLMGADRYDWRAIKLFVRLKHRSPQQDVRVVRDGLAEFGLWQRINRQLIQLDGTKADEVH